MKTYGGRRSRQHDSRGSTTHWAGLAGLTVAAVTTTVLSVPSGAAAPDAGPQPRFQAPELRVTTVVSGLEHAWDVKEIDSKRLIVTERDRARVSLVTKGRRKTVKFPSERVWVSGETGLMSVALAANFSRSRIIYTCQGWLTKGGHDVRVVAWRLNRKLRKAKKVRVIRSGMPTTEGRHGGCRLLVDPSNGEIWVGTGEAAMSGVSRNLDSLGGKVLRLTAKGRPSPANPWANSSGVRRFIYTYGHRNVQGLAQASPGGAVWSVEHGPSEDDEVNLLQAGGDYGWEPGPGYDSSVPMTDHDLPGEQIDARWSSGSPTLATSGAAWVTGSQWGDLERTLAVAALKEEQLLFLRFDSAGTYVSSYVPEALEEFGRLRSVTSAADGSLLVTTDNGSGDVVLRVSPS